MSDDIIEVAARVNYVTLRALVAEVVDEVVTERLKRLVQRPISDLAGHLGSGGHDDEGFATTRTVDHGAVPGPRRNQILRAAPSAPPKPKAPKAPKKSAAAASTTTVDDPAGRIVATLRAHPDGIRGAALRGILGWDKGFYSYHMRQATLRNLLKVKGQKGGATYFPNEKGIEKFMGNGAVNGISAPAETSAAN